MSSHWRAVETFRKHRAKIRSGRNLVQDEKGKAQV
jgi:hypothetical protein